MYAFFCFCFVFVGTQVVNSLADLRGDCLVLQREMVALKEEVVNNQNEKVLLRESHQSASSTIQPISSSVPSEISSEKEMKRRRAKSLSSNSNSEFGKRKL